MILYSVLNHTVNRRNPAPVDCRSFIPFFTGFDTSQLVFHGISFFHQQPSFFHRQSPSDQKGSFPKFVVFFFCNWYLDDFPNIRHLRSFFCCCGGFLASATGGFSTQFPGGKLEGSKMVVKTDQRSQAVISAGEFSYNLYPSFCMSCVFLESIVARCHSLGWCFVDFICLFDPRLTDCPMDCLSFFRLAK